MNTDNIFYKTEILDGREVYLPEIEEWRKILASEKFIGLHVKIDSRWIEYNLELTKKYSELFLALYQPGLIDFGLLPIVILKIENNWQRVHLEHLRCESCDWYGATANPMLSDLYIGTPNWISAMKSSERYPIQPCPRCNSKLPRHPIWVEPLLHR